jgi:peptidoglycan/xylan/chitin deacetylase (PgdA/CDA1 family)
MYHRITSGDPGNLYERNIQDLKKDFEYLRGHNINVINFYDLAEIKESGKMPKGNYAIITFDDGDHSWFSLVQPLLKEYKYSATFFLWVYMIGRNSFLDWKDVELMSHYTLEGGIRPFTFGSHSFSHQYLYSARNGFSDLEEYNRFLDYEFRESKRIIEEHVPASVEIFALPFGDGAGDDLIIAAAERNGFKFIRTSNQEIISTADSDLFSVPAIPMLDKTESKAIGFYLGL